MLRKKDIIIRKGDGTIINKSNYILQTGDQLLISQILTEKFAQKSIDETKKISIEDAERILNKMIIFDNENITIVNKSNGFSVQGGTDPKTNLFSLMSSRFKKEMIYITHRLDKPTSGLVIFAKNRETAQLIQMSMEERNTFHKFYLAESSGPNLIKK